MIPVFICGALIVHALHALSISLQTISSTDIVEIVIQIFMILINILVLSIEVCQLDFSFILTGIIVRLDYYHQVCSSIVELDSG